MKRLSHLKSTAIFITLLSTFTCSNNTDDGDSDNNNPSGESYINYSVTGSAVNGTFSISSSQDSNETNITIIGHISNESTDQGSVEVASLIFSRSEFGTNYRDVEMVLPSHTGPLAVGEIITGSTGIVTDLPTFHVKMAFDEEAFYDSDNDTDNDLLTHLLSKSMSVTITEIEETTNTLGILTLSHIKGSFEGIAYYKAYTGPTSDPEVLLHSVSGEFEYNIPVN